jgi:MFS family permease
MKIDFAAAQLDESAEQAVRPKANPIPRERPFSGFRLPWSGQSTSLIGSQVSSLAIQVIAVRALHADAMQMGYLTASQTIPYLAFSLFIGVLSDRSPKRGLMIGSDVIRALILMGAALLVGSRHLSIAILCGVVCLISALNLIFDAALGAWIPELCDLRQRLR